MLISENNLLYILKRRSFEAMKDGLFFHDYIHAINVFKNVEKIIRREKLIEKPTKIILLTAALFHDMKRNRPRHGLGGSLEVGNILRNVEYFPREYIKDVERIIASHDSGQINLDEKIFFDADKMDLFNELGLARSFMMYSCMGFSLREACFSYDKLLDTFFQGLYTKSAVALVKDDYIRMKDISKNLLGNYKDYMIMEQVLEL